MSDSTETVKIKPSHESQGAYVLINKSDFDSEKHEMFVEDGQGGGNETMTVAGIKAALAAKNIPIPDGVTKKADLQALLEAAA